MSPGASWLSVRTAPAALTRTSAGTWMRTTRRAMPTPVVTSKARPRTSTTRTAPCTLWLGAAGAAGGRAGAAVGEAGEIPVEAGTDAGTGGPPLRPGEGDPAAHGGSRPLPTATPRGAGWVS